MCSRDESSRFFLSWFPVCQAQCRVLSSFRVSGFVGFAVEGSRFSDEVQGSGFFRVYIRFPGFRVSCRRRCFQQGSWTDGCMDACTDGRIGWVDGWIDGRIMMNGYMGGCMDARADGKLAGRMDGWLDGWMDAWMDGWMEG